MNYYLRALCTACLLAAPVHAALAASSFSAPDKDAPLIQISFGVLELDNQSAEWEAVSEERVDVDFSTLPAGGLEVEYVLGRGWVHWGVNPGISFAWKNDDTEIAGSLTDQTGGTLRVSLDNSLFLMEAHLGGYVRGRLNERITTYAAAGPMVMYGSHDVNDEYVDDRKVNGDLNLPETDSSDTNIGFYARAGIDFEIATNQYIGFGIRYLSTELDFDRTVGKLDIKGPEYVFTLTTRL